MSVASLANTSVQVLRESTSLDNNGGVVRTYATHLRLKARVQALSGAEIERYSREQEEVHGKAYFPGAPDIKAKDRLKFRGKTAHVVNVRNPDELDHHTVVEWRYQEGVL